MEQLTAKEKAIQLVHKIYNSVTGSISEEAETLLWIQAKYGAAIVCSEMCENVPFASITMFYEQVKSEIFQLEKPVR